MILLDLAPRTVRTLIAGPAALLLLAALAPQSADAHAIRDETPRTAVVSAFAPELAILQGELEGNKTVVLRLTGAQVREALENGVSRAAHPSGRFPQVSGLAFSFDAQRPPGERVTRIAVGDAPLEDAKTYTLATNDFLARGGDDYRVFRAGEVLVDAASGALMAGQLIDHIVAAGTVAPAIEGRITRED